MFEQSLYGQDLEERPKSHKGDLFHAYEIRPWEISPRLYKIIAISAALNILALFVVAQTSLLTMKGCDSPFVSRVCQVLDTVYVGSVLFGTERDYVDAAYDRTDLADADITFVDVSNETGPLEYPQTFVDMNTGQTVSMLGQSTDPMAGYMDPSIVPGVPMGIPDPQNSLLNTTPITPPTNPNAVIGDLPTSPLGNNPTISTPSTKNAKRVRMPKMPNASPKELPGLDPNAVANANTNSATNSNNANTAVDEAKQDQYGVYINKRPLKDLAKDAVEKIDAKTVSIDKPFKVTITGNLGLAKDGKTIKLINPRLVRTKDDPKNDPEVEKLAQNAIIAVSDGGWFGYMTRLDPKPKTLTITVEQNETELVAKVMADQPTEAQANTQASSLGLLLSGAKLIAGGTDEKAFLENAQVTAEGKSFVLNFKLPKKEVQEMIMRKLAELKAGEGKPNGSAQVVSKDNTATK